MESICVYSNEFTHDIFFSFAVTSSTKFNPIQPNSTQFNPIQPNSTQFNPIQPNTTQHNATQRNMPKSQATEATKATKATTATTATKRKRTKPDSTKFTFVCQSKEVRVPRENHECGCVFLQKIQKTLDVHGLAIVKLPKFQNCFDDLKKTDPIGILKQFYHSSKHTRLSLEKLYGKIKLSREDVKDYRKLTPIRLGLINVYSSMIHQMLYNSPTYQEIVKKFSYGENTVIFPNRMRVQLPFCPNAMAENSHCDHNMVDLPNKYGFIVSLNRGRTFEYVTTSHTSEFWEAVRHNGYGKDKKTKSKNNRYIQFHLENAQTYDPMNLRKRWGKVVLEEGEILIWNNNLMHRIATKVESSKAVWSIYTSVFNRADKNWDSYQSSWAVPSPNKRTVADLNFTRPEYRGPMTLRESNIFALLTNYQTYKWPSGKPCSYFPPGSINPKSHIPWEKYKKNASFMNTKMFWRPVFPAGLGCRVFWVTECDKAKLVKMKIPVEAYNLSHWMFDPTAIPENTQRLLGFI
jgi:hypothetical protein